MRLVDLFPLWLAMVIVASPTPEPQNSKNAAQTNTKEGAGQNRRTLERIGTIGVGAVGGVLATLGIQRVQKHRNGQAFQRWLTELDDYNFGTIWTGSQILDCMARKYAELQEPYPHAQVHPTSETFNRWVEICSQIHTARADEDNPWVGEIDVQKTIVHPRWEGQERVDEGSDSNMQMVLNEVLKTPGRYWGPKPAGPGGAGGPLRRVGTGRP